MAVVYLIPTVLHEGANDSLPTNVLEAVKQCDLLFAENERTTRRWIRTMSKDIVIDDFQWFNIKVLDTDTINAFKKAITEKKTIGIVSEAGCPGIADPGQDLVAIAQSMNAKIKPLVGPSSILLALMASGMNGQQFQFVGYLPIENAARVQAIKKLETESAQKNCTQIFIETPYRNNQLLDTLIKTCAPNTRLCIAVDITAATEMIKTKSIKEWKQDIPQLHKRPAIFLLYSGN